MSSATEQIKERLDVVTVLSSYLKLEKSGKNFKARCPFHNEKTPSFYVSPERESYYCFGCGAKGDIFTFVQEYEGLDFVAALKLLADRAGITLPERGEEGSRPNQRLYDALEVATTFFEKGLAQNSDAKSYLEKRGIRPETTLAFRIGFVPGVETAGWRSLHDHLIAKGFSVDELVRAGLVKQKELSEGSTETPRYYDVFRSRIMLPIFDASGRVIAFSGRHVGLEDQNAPKYLNSKETALFKKSETLYGLDRAKGSIRKYDFAVLVEGPVDLIMAHQGGFTNTVAVMGTAFTEAHVERLRRLSRNLLIALDADDAGVASAKKTAGIAIAAGLDVKVAALPAGKDPADVLLTDRESWKSAVRSATHIVDFLLARLHTLYGSDDRKFKQHAREEVLPFVARIDDRIDQAHFVQVVARALSVDESIIAEEVARIPRNIVPGPETVTTYDQSVDAGPTISAALRQLLGIALWQEQANDPSGVAASIFTALTRILGVDPRGLVPQEEHSQLSFESEVAFTGSDVLSRHVDEMLIHVEEDSLKERFARQMQALVIAERSGNTAEAAQILTECTNITKQLNALTTKQRS